MIPKTIHYCWFGRNPLPKLAKDCIASWKKYLPDYEIKEWNEDNFDVNIIPYTAEAYRAKKYAFVSDYARFWILYHYGGLYFDTDVEVIKGMNDIIEKGAFMGCEMTKNKEQINPGLGLGATHGLGLYKEILETYKNKSFFSITGRITGTVVTLVTNIIKSKKTHLDLNQINQIEDITIYPIEYFCPLNALTNELKITENTYSIHHYIATWVEPKEKYRIYYYFKRIKYVLIHIYTMFFYKSF